MNTTAVIRRIQRSMAVRASKARDSRLAAKARITAKTTPGTAVPTPYSDGSSSEGNQVSHVYAQPGAYVVTQTVSEGCLSETTMDTVEVIFTDVEEIEALEMKIYPNPAAEEIHLAFAPCGCKATLFLSDVHGRQVLRRTLPEDVGFITLDTKDVPNGIYFVRLAFDNNKVLLKAVMIGN